ncbi:MAG: GNAT family N-acetyltransferase [Candidatus Latescibacteria bacterium]|nr:GNAT family N-acetyltransferase [Candidatus Latescibacterota bacterium]
MLPYLCIRPAVTNDLSALEGLVTEVFDTPECLRFFESHNGQAVPDICSEHALVAVQRDTIVGFILFDQDEFLGVVTGIGVRVTHRQFGVASLLVASVVDKLRADGLRVLDAVCDTHIEKCIGLFEKHKFRALKHEGSHVLLTRRLVGGSNRGDGFDV